MIGALTVTQQQEEQEEGAGGEGGGEVTGQGGKYGNEHT